jgi:predicted NBD/HSP70 family sugar kinase
MTTSHGPGGHHEPHESRETHERREPHDQSERQTLYAAHTIGIDVGGTFTKLVAMTPSGKILARARAATNDTSAERIIADIREQIASLESVIGPAAAIGVACPGLVRRNARGVHWMRGRLQALEGLDWTEALARETPVSAQGQPPVPDQMSTTGRAVTTGQASVQGQPSVQGQASVERQPSMERQPSVERRPAMESQAPAHGHISASWQVPVINDGHAALKAEMWLGAGRGCRDLVMLTLGTGVGGAILVDGRVLIGSTGRAGHLGHITVNATGDKDIVSTPGSLEDAIGNCTVARRTGGRFTSTDALIAAHLHGDRAATEVWQGSVAALAAALASIVNAVDPSRIILGGGITASAGDALFEPLRARMNDVEWRPDGTPVEIVAAQLGDEAGAIGAAKLAMESLARLESLEYGA